MRRPYFLATLAALGLERKQERPLSSQHSLEPGVTLDCFYCDWSHGDRLYVFPAYANGGDGCTLDNCEDFEVLVTPHDPIEPPLFSLVTTGETAVIEAIIDQKQAAADRLNGIVEYCGLLADSVEERQKLIDDALSAACLHIQKKIGQTDGGIAGQVFSGDTHTSICALLGEYLQTELNNLD